LLKNAVLEVLRKLVCSNGPEEPEEVQGNEQKAKTQKAKDRQ